MDRWATFDCYGTLVDWNAGLRGALAGLLPDVDPGALLVRYHALEPQVEAEEYRTYADVLARVATRIADEHGIDLSLERAQELPRSLPGWPVFPDVPAALEDARRRGWRLCILSNTDRAFLDASLESIGVPFDHSIVAEEDRLLLRNLDVVGVAWGSFIGTRPDVTRAIGDAVNELAAAGKICSMT